MDIHDAPICWEQRVLLVAPLPIYWIGALLGAILRPAYMLFGALKLPLLVVVLAFNAIWGAVAGLIYLFARISLAAAALRPVSFLLALPFLLAGAAVVVLAPMLSPADVEAKMVKLRFIEKFPYSAEMFQSKGW